MKYPEFNIRLLSIQWLKGVDDRSDLCAHGAVHLEIGSRVLSDASSGSGWTVSAAGLHLMRTVFQDHEVDEYLAQMVPCCGFFMIAAGRDEVQVMGCDSGFDWKVVHRDSMVLHVTPEGEQGTIAL